MRIRDLITSGVWLTAFGLHFAAQWFGWKTHIGEIALANGESLWNAYSYPLFVLVPRRIQNLHFFELLVANSVLWATGAAWLAHLAQRVIHRIRRLGPAAPAAKSTASATERTRADRLVELKRMVDHGQISREEYQKQRQSILAQ
ncbi:MAG TPA: hypothetical protein VMW17_14560 [Candidatus Binatia bacterium]|nr:hypothetical protein [Candidatus Binatia bacterium]